SRTRPARGSAAQILGAARVFVLGTLALVLFRLPIPDALAFWRALATWHAPVMPDAAIVLPIGASLGMDALQRITGDEVPFVTWRHMTRVALLAVVLLLGFWFTRAGVPEPFVYQGF